MADVDGFIDELGNDLSATYVPAVQEFVHSVGQDIAADAGPKVGKFVDDLVKDIFNQQSGRIQTFITALIKDIAQRYHPELTGSLKTSIVDKGIEISSSNIKLELKKRATGDVITTLDLPVFVRVDFDEVTIQLTDVTIDPQA